MRYMICVFGVVASVLFCSTVLAQSGPGTSPNPGKLTIGEIEVKGNITIDTAAILSRVRSRVGELFDAGAAAEDAKRIGELDGIEYAYYSTVVVENKVKLIFEVLERNLVRAIIFNGNRKYKAATLRKKLDFQKGDYLKEPLAIDGLNKLVEFYHKKGFAFVQISLDEKQLEVGRVIYNINEGARVKIKAVTFAGNESIKTGQLKKAIKTKKKKWLLLDCYYNKETLDEDIIRLEKVYENKGFLNHKITAATEFAKDNKQVYITFTIVEGPKYFVEKIIIEGNKFFDDKTLLTELKVQQGMVYNAQSAELDAEHITKRYREIGYIDAKVVSKREFMDVPSDKVKIVFDVTEGGQFRIGRVNITGNTQTQDKVIRRILDESNFKPGQWYNADIARGNGQGRLEKDVRASMMAESATITPVGTEAKQRDAMVAVVEGQTGSLMLGAGVDSSMGVIGQLIYEQRNFDIKDRPKSFYELITGRAFKGAGQKLRIALEPGTEVSQYSISFTEPYLKDKPVSLDVAGSMYERDLECYDDKRTRGYVGFEKRLKNHWRRGISFRVENVDIADIDSDAPKEISSVSGDNFLAGVRLSATRDLTDSRFNPTKGTIISAGYEQVGGDHTFGKLSGTYRWYRTIHEDLAGRKTVLAYKLHAATVVGDAPPFEMFYAGGMRSIRGFDYRGVSTRANNADKDPIGSDWIFLANAEATVPLVSKEIAAMFFVDSGAIDSGGYRAAVGTGIQILIPNWFGPVPMRFAIAVPLMKDDDDDTQVFSFSVGRLF